MRLSSTTGRTASVGGGDSSLTSMVVAFAVGERACSVTVFAAYLLDERSFRRRPAGYCVVHDASRLAGSSPVVVDHHAMRCSRDRCRGPRKSMRAASVDVISPGDVGHAEPTFADAGRRKADRMVAASPRDIYAANAPQRSARAGRRTRDATPTGWGRSCSRRTASGASAELGVHRRPPTSVCRPQLVSRRRGNGLGLVPAPPARLVSGASSESVGGTSATCVA